MPTAAVIRLTASPLLVLCLTALPNLPAQAGTPGKWKISGFPGGPAAELTLDPRTGTLTIAWWPSATPPRRASAWSGAP